MDPTRDDGQMDCTEPKADALGPEVAAMDVCLAAEHPKETERDEGSTDEERPSTGVSEHTTVQPQDENKRYERNLKTFLENGKITLELRSSGERNASERLLKSDGVLETRVDYRGNMSKISSILSEVKLKRSSAPPTYEIASRENPETKEIVVVGQQNTTTESIGIPQGNLETPVTFRSREIPGPSNDINYSKTPSSDFKAPVLRSVVSIPGQDSTPMPLFSSSDIKAPVLRSVVSIPGQDSTPMPLFSSPGTSMIRVNKSTPPVLRRPTDFVLKPRKSFYMFSPEDSGILRQCQSMPDINSRRRKEEKQQRRSIALDDRSRIVRSLFRDPPGPATPETRLSMVPKSHIPRPSREAVTKEAKGRFSLGSVKASICRKLTFLPKSNTSAAPMEEENTEDGKRKETSPPFADCPLVSVKKFRISPKPEKREDVGTGSQIRGQESNVPGEISGVPKDKKENSVKRKSEESSSPKEK